MKNSLVFTLAVILLLINSKVVLAQNFDKDIAGYGFNRGIAAQEVPANGNAEITGQNIQVIIPSKTFRYPITFEILQGDNLNLPNSQISNSTIVTNFAFRVRNHQTNHLIGPFPNPVTVKVTLPGNFTAIEVWEAELTQPLTLNPTSQSFQLNNNLLTLQTNDPTVGWIITDPNLPQGQTQTELPASGGNRFNFLKTIGLLGGLFLVGGTIFYFLRRK